MTGRAMEFGLTPEVRECGVQARPLRRDLHRHPELGFREVRTAGIVAERLRALGYEVRTEIARTGVVGLLRGSRPGRTVLLRADMDALPLPEEGDAAYRSSVPDVMHACGHDGHVAMALVAAEALAAMRDRLSGNVKLCFQPAEEGPGGALPMIQEGVLEDPHVDFAFGLHLWNNLDAGQVGVGRGPIMAAADEFEVVVSGPGGHGAYPHQTLDPVLVASHIVTALQSVVSRNISPLDPAVVTVGMMKAGYAFNIIPTTATLTGTLRSYSEEVRLRLSERVREIAEGVGWAFGARVGYRYSPGYPPTVNDAATAARAAEWVAPTFGAANVVEPKPSMGGEDMSYFLRAVPGAFLFLGSRNADKRLESPHHSPTFDFDEDVLPAGADALVRLTLGALSDP